MAAAYRRCRRLARRHYENFPVASLLLPRPLRGPVAAVYAFAREADDLADEGDLPPETRLERLDRHEAALAAAAAGRPPDHPTFLALADVFARYRLPVQPFRDLLTAFRMDVRRDRYADFEALLDYCRHSADPVGRILLGLFGACDPENRRLSDRVCTALQLLNFLQDIEPDYRLRGRIYLPRDELRAYGVEEGELAGGAGPGLRELLQFQVRRTRGLLHEGMPLVGRVPWRLGLQLAVTVEAADLLLARKERAGRPLERPRIHRVDLPRLLARGIRRLSRSRPPAPAPRR